MHTFALLLLCIFSSVKSEDYSTNRSLDKSQEERLMKYLNTQPVTAPNDVIDIYAHFFLQFFKFGHDETTFQAFGTLLISWVDKRLSWNTSDYGGLSEIVYDSYLFWEPHISLLNQVDYDEYEYHYGLCRLYNDGMTGCLPKIIHQATCHTMVSNWPYDVQNCTIQIGLFGDHSTINITKTDDFVTFLIGGEYSAFWTVLNVNHKYSQIDSQLDKWGKGSQIDITFLLKREGAGLGATVVFPIITLTILSLCSFFLCARNLRLGILCFNLLCHFLFLSEISDLIPKHSIDCPTILFYLRGSVLLNMLLVMWTIFLSSLSNIKTPVPTWISDFNEYVLESKAGFLVLRLNETKNITSKELVILSEWSNFSDLLNSFSLWLAILVYVCFMCLYLPRESRLATGELNTFQYK